MGEKNCISDYIFKKAEAYFVGLGLFIWIFKNNWRNRKMKYIWINPVVMQMYEAEGINLHKVLKDLGYGPLIGNAEIKGFTYLKSTLF